MSDRDQLTEFLRDHAPEQPPMPDHLGKSSWQAVLTAEKNAMRQRFLALIPIAAALAIWVLSAKDTTPPVEMFLYELHDGVFYELDDDSHPDSYDYTEELATWMGL